MDNHQEHAIDIASWLTLIRAEGVGPILFHKLTQHFGTPQRVLGATVDQLTQVEGIGPKTAAGILSCTKQFDSDKELQLAEELGVYLIHTEDPRYPVLLKRIYDPPPVLYIKGQLSRSHNLALAIVGSRHCSLYGQEQASRLAHLLASAGFTIVSGMARGIDTAAHQGALSAKGQTVAVQGCGLARVYPPENKRLYELISASGACISEFPLNYEALAENFPARNRTIAGLSLATLVVEAGYRSGALITARCALENDREVMAVPGRIDSPLSKGPHQLLRQGATLVESIDDIIEALGPVSRQLQEHIDSLPEASGTVGAIDIETLNLSPPEKTIYACLSKDPVHIDHIIQETRLPTGTVTASLVSLQLKGMVKNVPGNRFIIKS